MASKDNMEFEIIRTIETYAHLLKECRISRLHIFSWMEEMSCTYSTLCKAYKYIHGPFLKELKEMNSMWRTLKADTWRSLQILSPQCRESQAIREHKGSIKHTWGQRPKPRRKR